MTVIQLNPELQRSVHAVKRAELRKQADSFMVAQPLSAEETAALIKTFTTPSHTRQQDANEPSNYWW
ncbi:hypothetical protein A8709_00385 [Paenibacillus pectinilyticus]|uniref:Uncharacterized protein n=1 Tax=Paenibacillus pectinilyticus TaxID=512399 RepID=A0A1C1A894_9BACL|nr:hypothetical protein [Paenibacillus pectinilyticus]OCT16815.1 hypothetical protein A8709_00385 [Paenibacillus pectinilyticus]